MVKLNSLNAKRLDVAFQYMKTRSLIDNLSLLPLGNNIVICNRADNYKVYITSDPEARITRNNFAQLPEINSGKWIEYWSMSESTSQNMKEHPISKDKMISKFVTDTINNFVNPLYQRMEEEEKQKHNEMRELVVETKSNWKGFIEKNNNN